jgi:hypothetical protein
MELKKWNEELCGLIDQGRIDILKEELTKIDEEL